VSVLDLRLDLPLSPRSRGRAEVRRFPGWPVRGSAARLFRRDSGRSGLALLQLHGGAVAELELPAGQRAPLQDHVVRRASRATRQGARRTRGLSSISVNQRAVPPASASPDRCLGIPLQHSCLHLAEDQAGLERDLAARRIRLPHRARPHRSASDRDRAARASRQLPPPAQRHSRVDPRSAPRAFPQAGRILCPCRGVLHRSFY